MTKPTPAATLLRSAKLHRTVWGKRIVAAEIRGKFSQRTCRLAKEWPTCACGRVPVDIPHYRNVRGMPKDFELQTLGGAFWYAVDVNKFSRAARLLIQIERRAAIVAAGNRKATT